jgi:hypothetical protein
MKTLGKIVGVLLLVMVVGATLIGIGAYVLQARLRHALNPDPVTVATASLQAVREQAVLTPFAARFVAVVTSEQQRFLLSAKRTLILPGLVRYELDLAAMRQRDLNWNAGTHTLTVTLPPIRVTEPAIDLRAVQSYGEGGVLMTLTDAQTVLDQANREAGEKELQAQAREPVPMRLARDAARNAIQRSFAMPLKAAGIDATVVAKFPGE